METERVRTVWERARGNPQEASNLDFKQSIPWDGFHRDDLVKDILGMANHRDGGVIIIGVAEDSITKGYSFVGTNPDDFATYKDDIVQEYIAGFADPGVRINIERKSDSGCRFVLIEVFQFREVPVVCKKAKKQGDKLVLRQGAVYFRTAESKPQTREATAEDMRNLLDLMIEVRMRRDVLPILNALQTITPPPKTPSPMEQYDAELGEL